MASTHKHHDDEPDPNAIAPPEVIVVDGHRVSCDGGGGPLGHPKVYMELGDEDFVDCGYCDRRFVRRGSPLDPTAR
jgi:uncharacterized Zn-finger protein